MIKIKAKCCMCQKLEEIEVTQQELINFNNQVEINKCFPNLSEDHKHLLETSICLTCMKTIAKDIKCISCNQVYTIPVTDKQLAEWKAGKLAQDCFPNLSAAQREILISGLCNNCFNDLLGEISYEQ